MEGPGRLGPLQKGESMADETLVNEEQTELELEQKIRAKLEEEYQTRLQTEVTQISQKMIEENKKILETTIERFRKEMIPPSEQDIQKLLEQEYLEFTIDVKTKKELKHFTIRELPVEVEKKIYKKVKAILVPFSSELSALSLNILEGDAGKKVVQLMNAFEPMLDVMIGVCTICLNPFEEDDEITEEWVRKNLGSTRIVKIVTAQVEANKMRDFFSLLFRNTKLLTQ